MFKLDFPACALFDKEKDRILGKQVFSKGICNYHEIRYAFKHAKNRRNVYSCLVRRIKKYF